MNRAPLSAADFARAAVLLGVPEAAVRAVCEVEAPLGGFDTAGLPRILFEGHHFSRATGGRYDYGYPTLSYPRWVRTHYAKGSNADARNAGEHQRLDAAMRLDSDAALKSASWGRFQIMGSNHKAAGFASVQAFVAAMHRDEAAHLVAFCAFVRADPTMHRALRALDWAGFARKYNGPAYAQNSYDTKLASAYRKWQALQPAPPVPEPLPLPVPDAPLPSAPVPRPAPAQPGLLHWLSLLIAFFTRKRN